MTAPNFPNNPTIGQQFVVGNNTFQWDGEKWKALSNADNSLRTQLAAPDSTVLVGGVPAGILSEIFRTAKTPEDYGAVGDAVMVSGVVSGTDDTATIQAWVDGGGPYALRRKCNYRSTAEINMPAHPIIIVGLGRLPVYPYFFPNYGAAGNLPTFMVDHNGSDGFRFAQNSSARGSYLYGFNIIRAASSTCIRALGFNVAGSAEIPQNYGYDTTVDRVGIFDFESAVDLYDSSGIAPEPTMADITIRDCAINRNNWISRTLNGTAWNGFKFYDNKAGQQTVGGLDIKAHNFIEHGNFLEGMANPVKVSGAYKGCTVGGSYFEANAQPGGIYLYNLQALRGPTKVNTFSIVASNEGIIPVLGNNISNLISDSPAVIEAGYNCTYPEITGSISSLPEVDPLSFGISSVNSPRPIFKDAPPLFKTVGLYRATVNKERGINPFDGRAMVVEDLTTDAIATSRTVSITAAAYDYVTLSFMLKHEDDTVAKTYITVDIAGQAVGTRDYSFDDEVLHVKQGGWNVYTVTIKPQASISTVTLRVYPYGVGAAAGLPFQLSGISAYASDTVNSTPPWVNQDALNSVTVDPATGTWVVGDTFRNVSAAAGGQATFLYTAGGWVYS